MNANKYKKNYLITNYTVFEETTAEVNSKKITELCEFTKYALLKFEEKIFSKLFLVISFFH